MRTPGFTAEVSLHESANRYHVPGRTHRAGRGVHPAQASVTDLTLGTTEGSAPSLNTPGLPIPICYWRMKFIKYICGFDQFRPQWCYTVRRELVCNDD